MSTLALPDPKTFTVAQVHTQLVPMAVAWRESAREQADIGMAQDLKVRLEAFERFMQDRKGRSLVQAEVRRTEVLIGELLGPGIEGRPAAAPLPDGAGSETTQERVVFRLPRNDRERFRRLAEQAERVEELLTREHPVVARSAILDELKREPRGESVAIPPSGTFHTIVADPPWRYGNAGTRANAAGHYDGTLSVDQLCGREVLPDGSKLTDQVEGWRSEDCHLYLWTTAGFLREAFDVMESWGFEYKTFLAWVKPQMGMGNYFRVSSEIILFGVRGRQPIQNRGIKNWFEARRGKHSAKPQSSYDLIAKASPGPYLEMFSRCFAEGALPGTCHCTKCARGWEVWGNQA